MPAAATPLPDDQRFAESDLTFRFPGAWVVRKYDDTVAYQSLSGHGLKGVDFIALSPGGLLWLVEVKNYRPRVSRRNGREYRAKRKPPATLAQDVVQKFTDSQRLIRIVNAYLRRRWWRRLQLWWYARRGRAVPRSNYWFWAEAKRRCAQPDQIRFVLWMETPERKTGYDDEVATLVRAGLPAGAHLTVAEAGRPHDLPFGLA